MKVKIGQIFMIFRTIRRFRLGSPKYMKITPLSVLRTSAFSKIVLYCAPLRCAQAYGVGKAAVFFMHPALTSQRVRKNAPTLARRTGLLSFAPSGLALRQFECHVALHHLE
jgi:hypothetical protein